MSKSNFILFNDHDYAFILEKDNCGEWWRPAIDAICKAETEAFSDLPIDSSVIKLRTSLDTFVKNINEISGENLFEKIKHLSKVWPNCWVVSSMHKIRIAGNKAVHETSTQHSREDLVNLLEQIHNVIRWYLEDYTNAKPVNSVPNFKFEIYEKSSVHVNTKDPELGEDESEGEHAKSDVFLSKEDGLSEKQAILATLLSGKHFVNAPAGTGKTHLLTSRLNHVALKFECEEIICLTFTNRAAREMQVRAASANGDVSFFIGNIHAFCMNYLITDAPEIVRKNFSNMSILDDVFKKTIIEDAWNALFTDGETIHQARSSSVHKALFDEMEIDTKSIELIQKFRDQCLKNEFEHFKKCEPFLAIPYLLSKKSKHKKLLSIADEQWLKGISGLLEKESLRAFRQVGINDQDVVGIISIYLDAIIARKGLARCYDFDDLLAYGLIHAAENKKQYACIQLDEVQDLNVYQWALIDILSNDDTTIMAFGDMAQSIYSFMGAESKLVSEYTQSFTTHELDENYRSCNSIVKFANSYRETNLETLFLPSLPTKPDTYDDSTLLVAYENDTKECLGAVGAVKKIINSPDRNVGILLRRNKDVDFYASTLIENKINAFRLSGRDIMNRPIIVDFLSFIKVYSGNASRLDWYRIFYRFNKIWDGSSRLKRADTLAIIDSLFEIGVSPSLVFTPQPEKEDLYLAKIISSHHRSKRIVVFDTETTSIDTNEAVLLQLAAVAMEGGIVVDTFNQYISIDDERKSDPEFLENLKLSSEIHNISLADLDREGKSAESIFESFLKFLGDDETIIAAHNLSYDMAVLVRNIDEFGTSNQLLKFLKKTNGKTFDTLSISRVMYPGLTSYKLESLLEQFGLEGVNSHDALDDVKATASLINKLSTDLDEKVNAIDLILERHKDYFVEFNQHFLELFSLFASQDVNYVGPKGVSNHLRLSDILEQWINYAEDQETWYDSDRFKALKKEIQDKVVPWMVRNFDKARLQDIIVGEQIDKFSLLSEADLIDTNYDRVVVSTIHRAKGLQFETVIIPNVVDGNYPSFYSIRDNKKDDIEEDARLLYVAITRATDKLIISFYRSYLDRYSKNVSRFLEPLVALFDYKRT